MIAILEVDGFSRSFRPFNLGQVHVKYYCIDSNPLGYWTQSRRVRQVSQAFSVNSIVVNDETSMADIYSSSIAGGIAVCLTSSGNRESIEIRVDGKLIPVGDGKTLELPGGVGIARQGNVYQLTSEVGNSVRT